MPELVVRGSSVTITRVIFAALLPMAAVSAQTAVPYSYFAETGISYDYYGKVPASTTGFGVRIGNSNTFLVTDIDTLAHPGTSYATLRSGLEYHLAVKGNWEFIGLGSWALQPTATPSLPLRGGWRPVTMSARFFLRGALSCRWYCNIALPPSPLPKLDPPTASSFEKLFNCHTLYAFNRAE